MRWGCQVWTSLKLHSLPHWGRGNILFLLVLSSDSKSQWPFIDANDVSVPPLVGASCQLTLVYVCPVFLDVPYSDLLHQGFFLDSNFLPCLRDLIFMKTSLTSKDKVKEGIQYLGLSQCFSIASSSSVSVSASFTLHFYVWILSWILSSSMQASWQIYLASCSSVQTILELGPGDVEYQRFWILLSRVVSHGILPRKYRNSTKSVFLKSWLGILLFLPILQGKDSSGGTFSSSPACLQQMPTISLTLLCLRNPDSQAQLTHHQSQDKAQYNHASLLFKGWLHLLSVPAHPPQNSVSIQDNLVCEKPH